MDNPKVQQCYSTKFLLKNMDLVNWFVCADVCVKTHSAKIQCQTWKKSFSHIVNVPNASYFCLFSGLNCLNISWLDSVREMPNEAWCKLNSQSQAAKHAAILATSYHVLASSNGVKSTMKSNGKEKLMINCTHVAEMYTLLKVTNVSICDAISFFRWFHISTAWKDFL